MKDQKLIYAMRGIDDDLICEAMKRRSIGVEQDGENAETVYVSGRRTRRLWKYPVTAAAVLAVAGGALFVITYNGGISDNFGVDTSEETVGSAEETSGGGEITTNSTDTDVTQIAPIKTVDITGLDCRVLCVPSLPDIPNPVFGEECFNEMSTEELFEYYGLEFMLPKLIKYNQREFIDEKTKHGIYTSPDGTVDDINTFIFCKEEWYGFSDALYEWEKLTITIGKSTKLGQEYAYEHNTFWVRDICYNKESDTFFVVFNVKGGSTVMLSGTSDELGRYTEKFDPCLKRFSEANDGISMTGMALLQTAFDLFQTDTQLTDHDEQLLKEWGINPEECRPWGKVIDEITGDTMYYIPYGIFIRDIVVDTAGKRKYFNDGYWRY